MIYTILSDAVVLSILPCFGLLGAYIFMVATEDKKQTVKVPAKKHGRQLAKKRSSVYKSQTFLRAA